MDQKLEKILAIHCAPTLSGIKPACLFSCLNARFPLLKEELRQYNRALNPNGVFLEEIFGCKGRTHIMVYRKPLLCSFLTRPDIRSFLSELGYPDANGRNTALENMIQILKERIDPNKAFPHEIGLFLGYPLHDVAGFIENEGKNYKASGYWKVYQDEEAARALFREFTMCRYAFCKKLKSGMTVEQIINDI